MVLLLCVVVVELAGVGIACVDELSSDEDVVVVVEEASLAHPARKRGIANATAADIKRMVIAMMSVY